MSMWIYHFRHARRNGLSLIDSIAYAQYGWKLWL